jgi:putative DNA primase/helicase
MNTDLASADAESTLLSPMIAAQKIVHRELEKGASLVALHEYTDANGKPVFWRIRLKKSDGLKWIRPMRRDGRNYVLGEPPDMTTAKPLYRLHEVVLSDGTVPVFFVEGENCADALALLGLVATTAGSATSDDKCDFKPLAGREVRVWPDNDIAGRDHMQRVCRKLQALGCRVKWVGTDALALPDKGDVVDWLDTNPGATAANVLELPSNARDVLADRHRSSPTRTDGGMQVQLLCADQIKVEPIRWLWKGWLARGKLHVLAGAPGTGKTTIAMGMAATVSCGGRWPDGGRTVLGDVVIWTGEDDPADTLVPRLIACGAGLSRVHFVVAVRDDGCESRAFNPATDMSALQSACAALKDVRLLILDPIVNAMGAADSHKNAEVRAALAPVVELASKLDAAALGISHFTKGTQGRDPVERVTGSLAFGALPRVVLAAAKVTREGGDSYRLLARAKSNIGPDDGGFKYHIEQIEIPGGIGASQITWGESLNGAARDLLADAEQDDAQAGEGRSAADWLRDLLRDGPKPTAEVKAAAAEAGVAWRTLQRTMHQAGVKSVRSGFGPGHGFVWSIAGAAPPRSTPCAPSAPHAESGADGAHGGTDDGTDLLEVRI